VSRATRVALSVSVLVLVILSGLAGSYALTSYWVGRANRQWCDTLALLTSTPVSAPSNPASNPSRVAAYHLYEDFVHLRGQFGCN
jgi:hypothetical protein